MANDLSMSDPRVQEAITGLTSKQARWAWETAKNPSISHTEAYRRAGYKGTETVLGRGGWTNARNPKIIATVEALRRLFGTELKLSPEIVLADLERLQVKAEAKGDMSSAIRAAELRGKTLGLFVERTQIDDPAKARALAEKEVEEARRIAQIRLRDVG